MWHSQGSTPGPVQTGTDGQQRSLRETGLRPTSSVIRVGGLVLDLLGCAEAGGVRAGVFYAPSHAYIKSRLVGPDGARIFFFIATSCQYLHANGGRSDSYFDGTFIGVLWTETGPTVSIRTPLSAPINERYRISMHSPGCASGGTQI